MDLIPSKKLKSQDVTLLIDLADDGLTIRSARYLDESRAKPLPPLP